MSHRGEACGQEHDLRNSWGAHPMTRAQQICCPPQEQVGSIWAGQLRAQAPDESVAFTGTGREQEGSAPRRCPADRPRRETPAADADVSCDTRAGRCIMHTRTHETLPVGPAPRDRVGCGWLEEPRGRAEAFLWRQCWALGHWWPQGKEGDPAIPGIINACVSC